MDGTAARRRESSACFRTRGRNLHYRRDIDGLRAIAVLLVVGYHAAPRWIPGGFVGVDVFFVISGFLITGIIVRDVGAGKFSFAGFYARRCRRILPALAIVLAAVWLIGWRTLLSTEFDELGRDLVAAATFTTNIVLWHQAGYFATAAAFKPLLHLWSLGVEEQFYLVWPALLVYAMRRGLSLRCSIAIAALLSFVLNAFASGHHAELTFYLLPTRFWELLIGAWLVPVCGLAGSVAIRRAAISQTIAGLAVAAIVGSALLVDSAAPFPGWRAAIPAVSAAALIAVGRDAWLGRVALSSRIPVLIGLISYPLYLWHWPLLSFARITEEHNVAPSIRAGLVALSFTLAWLTWKFIERPVREQAVR